jgi:hypothetical protein
VACDKLLSDFEASRRSAYTGDFLDLCNACIYHISDVVETEDNFILYNPDVDDLDTPVGTVEPTNCPPDADEINEDD